MKDWQAHGRHRYRIDGEMIRWEIHGPLSVDDFRLMFDIWDAVAREYGVNFTTIDVREGVSIGADTRRYIAERTRTAPLGGACAVAGANIILRTLTQLVENACRLLGRPLPSTYFCSTLEEAEAWIEKKRQQRLDEVQRRA